MTCYTIFGASDADKVKIILKIDNVILQKVDWGEGEARWTPFFNNVQNSPVNKTFLFPFCTSDTGTNLMYNFVCC